MAIAHAFVQTCSRAETTLAQINANFYRSKRRVHAGHQSPLARPARQMQCQISKPDQLAAARTWVSFALFISWSADHALGMSLRRSIVSGVTQRDGNGTPARRRNVQVAGS